MKSVSQRCKFSNPPSWPNLMTRALAALRKGGPHQTEVWATGPEQESQFLFKNMDRETSHRVPEHPSGAKGGPLTPWARKALSLSPYPSSGLAQSSVLWAPTQH